MKILLKPITALAILGLVSTWSCKKDDDDFTRVTAFEKAIHDEVNDHRVSQGLNELVLQFVMVKEAKIHSEKMANGEIELGYETIEDRFDVVKDKLGGTNYGALVSYTRNQTAEELVASWIADTSYVKVLEGEYTQSGPGTAQASDGGTYVTHMFLNIPE